MVISAVCTHLGCVPIPYLGAFNGWVCICHGSVYDKVILFNQSSEESDKDQLLKIYHILITVFTMEFYVLNKWNIQENQVKDSGHDLNRL